MSATEMALAGPEVDVVVKASGRRFTMEDKRKIVRETDMRASVEAEHSDGPIVNAPIGDRDRSGATLAGRSAVELAVLNSI